VVLGVVAIQSPSRCERRILATRYLAGDAGDACGMGLFVIVPEGFAVEPSAGEGARSEPASEGYGAEVLLELFELLDVDAWEIP